MHAPVNTKMLNGYILDAITFFAIFLYFAVLATGFREMISRLPRRRVRRKHAKHQSALRRWRGQKKPSSS